MRTKVLKASAMSVVPPNIELTAKREPLMVGEKSYLNYIDIEFAVKFSPCANFLQAQKKSSARVYRNVALGLIFNVSDGIKHDLEKSDVSKDEIQNTPSLAVKAFDNAQKWGSDLGYTFGFKRGHYPNPSSDVGVYITKNDSLRDYMTYIIFPDTPLSKKIKKINGNYYTSVIIFRRDIKTANFKLSLPVAFTNNNVLQEFSQALLHGLTLMYWYDFWTKPIDGVEILLSSSGRVQGKNNQSSKKEKTQSWV